MIREILGSIFIAIGVIGFIIGIIGNFKFDYLLNRMHAAGIIDSFAFGSYLIGIIIYNGINLISLKLAVAALAMYFTSPVCSHMLAKLEVEVNDELEKHCEVEE